MPWPALARRYLSLRRFTDPKLVIASHNQGKVREIGDLLAPFGLEVVSAGNLQVEEPEETEETFIGNASLKALHTAKATGLPSLADDSGLAVAALGGRPGVHTAPYAEIEPGVRDFAYGMAKLGDEMADQTDMAAKFVCVLALAWPDEHVEVFEGEVTGHLTFPPRGEMGFGFDPVFVPKGHEITFAELDPADKHAMSHRADAFKKLVAGCFAN